MSTQINDGGPAFPQPDTYHPNGEVEYGSFGMSLRDWFAGQALCGLLGSITTGERILQIGELATMNNEAGNQYIAGIAYEHADAMLAERTKGASA